MLLDEKLVALENALTEAGIPHAFGGAHALAYYAAPRATVDIDVNVFVRGERAHEVFSLLGNLGVDVADPALAERAARDGQVRLRWQGTPLDLFFSYDPLHDSSLERRRSVDFGGDRIHVLSAEDLMVYKVLFDREKDWRDLAEMVYAAPDSLHFDYVRGWLGAILAEGDARLARFERVVDTGGSTLG